MIYRIEENDGTKCDITLRDRVQGEHTNNPYIEVQWSVDFSGCADLTFLNACSSVMPVKYNINPELKSKPGYLQFCRRMIVVLYIIEHLPDWHPSKRALNIKPENRRKIYPESWHDISRSDYWNLPGGYVDAPNDNSVRVIKENQWVTKDLYGEEKKMNDYVNDYMNNTQTGEIIMRCNDGEIKHVVPYTAKKMPDGIYKFNLFNDTDASAFTDEFGHGVKTDDYMVYRLLCTSGGYDSLCDAMIKSVEDGRVFGYSNGDFVRITIYGRLGRILAEKTKLLERGYTGNVKIKKEVTKTYKFENGKAEVSSVQDKLDTLLFKEYFKSADDVQKFLNDMDHSSTYIVEEEK